MAALQKIIIIIINKPHPKRNERSLEWVWEGARSGGRGGEKREAVTDTKM